MTTELKIAVLPGDGIGVEVMDACLAALEGAGRRIGGYRLATEVLAGRRRSLSRDRHGVSDENFKKTEAAADAILFGAMGGRTVRYPDGTEIAPQLEMRRDSSSMPASGRSRPHPGVPRAARRSTGGRRSIS